MHALVSKVQLPWYNSYRFFFSQVDLLKNDHGVDFMRSTESGGLFTSTNVMDRWILASLQSLTGFVHQEMDAYRLYTVVPRLLDLIDDITNWYIRFNRKRLKGENGTEDTIVALSTLHEVLYSMSILMVSSIFLFNTFEKAPFTPFITETMYQNLKLFFPKGYAAPDDRSVHFLMIPKVKEAYFDADIERAVSRMRNVIELGRYLREKNTLPLKTPLRELVIISSDEKYLEDVRSLQDYIYQELNVRTLTLTSREEQYGVKYELKPDHKVLGIKYKKDASKIKAGLGVLTEKDAIAFNKEGKITVAGFELGPEDLRVSIKLEKRDLIG